MASDARLDRNSRPRPASRHFDRHGVARVERPRRRQSADAPARARSGGEARLFAQSIRAQPAARQDRPRRHDRPQSFRRHADQHRVPLRARRTQASPRARTASTWRSFSKAKRTGRLAALRRVTERGLADALIIADTRGADPRVDYLAKLRRPFVTFGRTEGRRAPRVGRSRFRSGDRRRGRPSRGARPPADRLWRFPKFDTNYVDLIEAGYRRAMRSRGLRPPTRAGTSAARQASAAASKPPTRCSPPTPRPTAVVLTNSMHAAALYRRLGDAGLRPGRDVSILALLPEARAQYLIPTLTSYQTDWTEIGDALAKRWSSNSPGPPNGEGLATSRSRSARSARCSSRSPSNSNPATASARSGRRGPPGAVRAGGGRRIDAKKATIICDYQKGLLWCVLVGAGVARSLGVETSAFGVRRPKGTLRTTISCRKSETQVKLPHEQSALPHAKTASRRSGASHARENRPPVQATQPIENSGFGRETPRKSKTIPRHERRSSARTGPEPRKPKRIAGHTPRTADERTEPTPSQCEARC